MSSGELLSHARPVGDAVVLRAMLDAEVALVRAWAALGLAPAEAVRAVEEAARGLSVPGLAERARASGNPVIPLAAALKAAAGPWAHRGATSQDILDSALMLVAHRVTGSVLDDLERTAGALRRLAAAHRDTVMAGRTLTQHAVPTTFGLKAAGWRSLVLDARDRLRAVRQALPAQLGGAAGTMAAFGAHAQQAERESGVTGGGAGGGVEGRLVEAFARELGLATPALPWHVLRTPVADLASALAFTTGALGKLAADVLVLSRTEIGELAEGTTGGSSAMPHKNNPVLATWIASAARQVPNLAATLHASMAAEDERPAGAWHAEWQTLAQALGLVEGAAADAAELAGGLRVHPGRMRENLALTGGLVVSERVSAVLGRTRAEELITRGEPFPEELADPEDYLGVARSLADRALERS
ncbi:lyase family protein [Nonomuraea soli]|uniref:3-carboxy-cis,cis-muconate cycloisomerase n=1 Tax=Nonomuraea soli TaxID=1032476 RepID=A0A7W0HUX7_9ACTN|nr:lyase family protein [Nonomuraea soli]MBA2896560.1 3-carboxy-cis,cis-muconate cycloisomerase [Nonomuraea soli]